MDEEFKKWREHGAPKFTEEELEFMAKMNEKYKYVSWLMFWPMVEQNGMVIVNRQGWDEIQERERKFKELCK